MVTITFSDLIPPTITLVITSLFGLLIGVLVERFKNRLRTIEYTISSQKIIPPLSQSLGGQLSIKLNEREINTLKVATVEIENKNSIDLENIVVRFSLGHNSFFQGNEAFITNNYSALFWAQSYNDNFNQILDEFNKCDTNPENGNKIIPDELQPRIDYVLANRDYSIPVFNRRDKAVFNFLIEDPIDGTEAGIFPTIVHKSIHFIKKTNSEKQKQKELWLSIIIGIVFVSACILVIILNNIEQRSLIIWSAVTGFSYSIVGYFLLFAFRKIRSFFK